MNLGLYRGNRSASAPFAPRQDFAYARSYLALRQTVGWIGIFLPAVLIAGNALLFHGAPFIHSLSRYYYTEMRNVFVGGLCAMAVFLFHYCGPVRRQRVPAFLAGIFALGVAFFPVAQADQPIGPTAAVHYACALGLFLTLALMSLLLFGRGPDAAGFRNRRNIAIHRACGLIVIGSVAMNIWHAVAADCDKAQCGFVLWTETAALAAFGISWLVEGRSFAGAAAEPEARAA